MALAYLTDPQKQFSDKSGSLNVAGFLRVYLNGTDDRAITYKDFNGTLNTADIVLDNNGRAVVIADTAKAYRLEVYTRDGDLLWTQFPLNTLVGGAAGASGLVIESSDGSISVDRYSEGSLIHYDLSANVEDGTDLLEWIRCDGGVVQPYTDVVKPTYSAGTMFVGDTGVQVKANSYYHVTTHLRATKSDVDAYYDNVDVLFSLGSEPVTRQSVIIDYSMGLSQDFEVSTDVKVDVDSELNLSIIGASNAGGVELLNLEMHRVYSGTPVIPGGVQRTLIAGANITIEHTATGDVISSIGGSDYTAGTGIVVDNTDRTISVANNVVIDGSYVHTDNNFTDADASKLSGIEAGAQANVQSDWDVNDASSDAYIRNRPTVKPVVAGNNITITETSESFAISATSQVQSDWNQNNDQAVDFIKNRPTIPEITIGTVIIG